MHLLHQKRLNQSVFMSAPEITLFGVPKTPIHTLGLGVFDGLHRGHMAIASQCQAILTLSPHPALVLGKKTSLKILSTLQELRHLFPQVIHLPFTKEVSQLEPTVFLETVIYNRLAPTKIIVGYDYRFGAGGKGDFAFLENWASRHGIETVQISPLSYNGQVVKSSDIRTYLLEGPFDQAIALLGHPYLIMGPVVHGEGRGKKLGFPTANLQLPTHKLVPQLGVYAGTVLIKKESRPAIIYIGKKPTFGEHEVVVEVHIPGFNQPLYGKNLAVFLTKKIRGEMVFTGPEALIKQIQLDLTAI
ncbi:MAG: riboflavin biosynthesis protein RibF [Candidatus Margulisbacteria bacterium]|nr:riboflavin biosynthesis protein RibF [Candidatus Margulisiibacteriota bacterium]